jgi:Protein of unknown function (DUF3305)
LDAPFERSVSIPLGVVVTREAAEHAWQSRRWRPHGVFLDAPAIVDWQRLLSVNGSKCYHAATLPLLLQRSKIAGYTVNLSNGVPSIYVVMRELPHGSRPPAIVDFVTASPFDVEGVGGMPGEIVGRVAMPADLIKFVAAFVENRHDGPMLLRRQTPVPHARAVQPLGQPLGLAPGTPDAAGYERANLPRFLRDGGRH